MGLHACPCFRCTKLVAWKARFIRNVKWNFICFSGESRSCWGFHDVGRRIKRFRGEMQAVEIALKRRTANTICIGTRSLLVWWCALAAVYQPNATSRNYKTLLLTVHRDSFNNTAPLSVQPIKPWTSYMMLWSALQDPLTFLQQNVFVLKYIITRKTITHFLMRTLISAFIFLWKLNSLFK